MELVSVNVGPLREVPWRGRTIRTGIFKEPVAGRVTVRRLGLDGDRQADPRVHGGPSKAVYAYPVEHYGPWRGEYPGIAMPPGMFGENLTTRGLREDEVSLGDRFRIGRTELMVTEPRMPCFKLGIKFGRTSVIKRLLASGRSGFYLAVLREGDLGAGDAIEVVSRDPQRVRVSDAVRLFAGEVDDLDLLDRAVRVDALPDKWRAAFRLKIEAMTGRT